MTAPDCISCLAYITIAQYFTDLYPWIMDNPRLSSYILRLVRHRKWGVLLLNHLSLISLTIHLCKIICRITFIYDRCHCSWAAVTPVKYECDIQYATSVFMVLEKKKRKYRNRENLGSECPPPQLCIIKGNLPRRDRGLLDWTERDMLLVRIACMYYILFHTLFVIYHCGQISLILYLDITDMLFVCILCMPYIIYHVDFVCNMHLWSKFIKSISSNVFVGSLAMVRWILWMLYFMQKKNHHKLVVHGKVWIYNIMCASCVMVHFWICVL